MALPIAVYECRSSATAGNVNGGGFNSARGGTDYTLQDAAQIHSTDGVSTASTNFTSVTGGFTDAMKGNFLHLISATGADEVVGWYEIVSVTDGNTLVLDRTSGTYTLADFYIGGAMSLNSALDDAFFEIMIAGSTIYMKNGSFSLGESLVVLIDGTSAAPIVLEGYNSARGDAPTGASRPTIACGANSMDFTGAADWLFRYLIITSTNATAAIAPGAENHLLFIKATNTNASSTGAAFGSSSSISDVRYDFCEAIDASGRGFEIGNDNNLHGCVATGCAIGVKVGGGDRNSINFCIFDGCAVAIDLSSATSESIEIINCTLYGAETPAGTGIDMGATQTSVFINNIIYGFTTGITATSLVTQRFVANNNFYNNTTNRTNFTTGTNDIALDPGFTDGAGGNFAVGANMKAAGIPGVFPGATSTGYLDIGAVQRQEPTGSFAPTVME